MGAVLDCKKVSGNLLEDDAEALVNPVNCEGVMGAGLARQFRLAHPEMFEDYSRACKQSQVRIGKMHVFEMRGGKTRYIINFPTKDRWDHDSRYEYIISGLGDLSNVITDKGIRSIAIPMLGCGLGQLDWTIVELLTREQLRDLGAEVRLYGSD